jgi:UvrD-like helicase C-terminal domain
MPLGWATRAKIQRCIPKQRPDICPARDCCDTVTTIELEPFCKPATAQNRASPPVLRQPDEEAPIGLILCAESSREQVELQQMHKDGITVAEYWTELPPKAELEQKLHAALVEAGERLARRGCCWGAWMMSDDMKVSKGLGFPVVALTGLEHMPAKGKDEQEAAQVFYVAATRATQRLVIGLGVGQGFGQRATGKLSKLVNT